MRVLIVDDEAPARKRLRRLLEQIAGIDIVAEAVNGEQALELARQYRPALILMDIQMPGLNGLDAARQLAGWENAPALVFCTAYDEHALAAFEVAAIDYLLKPIERAKLEKALHRAERFLSEQIPALERDDGPHLLINTAQGIEKLLLGDVFYFRAEQKYVVAVHRAGETLLRESLQQLEQAWPEHLIRAHRNTLITRHSLQGIVRDGAGYRACLKDSLDNPLISRRHLSAIKAVLRQPDER